MARESAAVVIPENALWPKLWPLSQTNATLPASSWRDQGAASGMIFLH